MTPARRGRHYAARPPRLRRTYVAAALATIGLGVLVGACALEPTGWTDPIALGEVPPADTAPGPPPSREALPVMSWGRPVPAVPGRLSLPATGVDAPVLPVTQLPGGGLNVPNDPRAVGWWQSGASPGDPTGTVVIDGHVDSARDGPGALFDLAEARPGQEVVVDTSQGQHRYVLTALRSYPKAELPAEIFTTAGRPRLVLITCGGAFDSATGQYADNIVAYAVPA